MDKDGKCCGNIIPSQGQKQLADEQERKGRPCLSPLHVPESQDKMKAHVFIFAS